ncbi:GNAT family N-acetyltransferase [Dongia sp.]|uniref:GNAT family N-acetyltransferase n=1 Tax=Dongia sp. TaxID=1977262 RepID=UPI0035AE3D08
MAPAAIDPAPELSTQAAAILRPVTPFDLDLLALLHQEGFKESWDRPWSRQSFAEILAMPGSFGLIIALPGAAGMEPVGFGLILAAGDEVEVLLLTLLPRWRKRGLAHRLLLALLYHADRGGAGRAVLEVAAPNIAAIALYEKAGFTPCGRRRNYYAPGVDAIIYERFLSPGNIQPKSDEEPGNTCE